MSNECGVRVSVNRVEELPDGTFLLWFPAYELPEADRETIHRLFPTVTDKVYDLLNVEAVLTRIVPGSMPMPKKPAPKAKY